MQKGLTLGRMGLLVVWLGSACHSRTKAVPAQSAAPQAPAAPQQHLGLPEALCGSDASCQVKQVFKGAPGNDGEARWVAIASRPPAASAPDAELSSCQMDDVWIVHLAGDGTVVDRQLVGDGCTADTPYGVACDGLRLIHVEPPASAAPNSVVVGWEAPGPGCGGWERGSGEIEVELDSFRVLRKNDWSGRAAGPADSHTRRWDFTELSFTSEWDTANDDTCPARKRGPAFAIPKLELARAFLDGAWQTASFDQCAATLHDARGLASPGTAQSAATVRALLSEKGALFVDVVDVSGAPQTKPDGRLQICFAASNSQSYDYCRSATRAECVQISLEGRRLSGRVAVVRASDKPRFRVQLPTDTSAIGITYVDAGGRTLGNSAYLSGDATSLGQVFSLSAAVATCELKDGRLEYEVAPRRSAQALLDVE